MVLAVPKLLCPTCNKSDKTYVEYTCTTGLHSEIEPPRPDGHPATRGCPDVIDGHQGLETGRVIACGRCAGTYTTTFA